MNENTWKWNDQKITDDDVYKNNTVPLIGGHWFEGSYEHCKICPLKTNQCSPYRCPVFKQTSLHIHETESGTVISDIPSDDRRRVIYLGEINHYGNIWAFPSSDLFTDKSKKENIFKRFIRKIKGICKKIYLFSSYTKKGDIDV